ncbi:MAG TPA: S-adenosyl-l-methionine hydroxide adenosyltransferase family protein [Terriglobia bacterium]|nr:S-adenosyl-l-methionine hydroxide adenosyltransferase family protein [Terriglobia bacterium]
MGLKLSTGFQTSRFPSPRRAGLLNPGRAGARALALVLVLWSAAFALAAARGAAQSSSPEGAAGHPAIVFMTDFGSNNDAVPICKGVMLGIVPDLRIVDLTHEVKPYSILDGARFLFGATPYFPAGTVFLVVIDPGVGSARKAVVVKSKRGQFFVVPDNGLLTLVADRDGLESAREITNPAWMIGRALSSTFHGRDIFSPAAAHLARGDDWSGVGPELDLAHLVRLDIPASKVDEKGIRGAILALDDPFGSLISNIDGEDLEKAGYSHGDQVAVTLGSLKIVVPFVKTFSDVAVGRPLLYIDSRGHVALAVNQGDFSRTYHVKPVTSIYIPRKHGPAEPPRQ